VATLYPDLVLRHVMPVFTFMGASTIRHDDNYTFTVMQKSLRAILPSMVKQGGIGVSDVLRIFVDNFKHVPLHRRLHLFASVLQTLSLKYLPDLLLLFLVKHVTQVQLPSSFLGSEDMLTPIDAQGPQEQTQMKLDQSVSIDENDLVDLEVQNRLVSHRYTWQIGLTLRRPKNRRKRRFPASATACAKRFPSRICALRSCLSSRPSLMTSR
jgi:hypothetical protein